MISILITSGTSVAGSLFLQVLIDDYIAPLESRNHDRKRREGSGRHYHN
jgi:hypothetical protein